jgi:hypothetical protein
MPVGAIAAMKLPPEPEASEYPDLGRLPLLSEVTKMQSDGGFASPLSTPPQAQSLAILNSSIFSRLRNSSLNLDHGKTVNQSQDKKFSNIG